MIANRTEIEKELLYCTNMIRHIERELKKYSSSKIKFRRNKERGSIYEVTGSKKTNNLKEQYISIYSDYAKECAQKKYYTDLLDILNQEADALKQFLDNYDPEEKYDIILKYPNNISKLISPLAISLESREAMWEMQEYEKNPMPVSDPVYTEALNTPVRSKAEAIMADWLFDNGISFRYEAAYRIKGKTYYPDFTILSPYTGEVFYIEYFGLMDNPQYARSAFNKIMTYSGTPDGHRFIYIFEGMGYRFSPEIWKPLIVSKLKCNTCEVSIPE